MCSPSRATSAAIWIAPIAWVAGEWLRGWFFSGFPWVLVGTSQMPWLAIAQSASLAGVWGLSALIVAAWKRVCEVLQTLLHQRVGLVDIRGDVATQHAEAVEGVEHLLGRGPHFVFRGRVREDAHKILPLSEQDNPLVRPSSISDFRKT